MSSIDDATSPLGGAAGPVMSARRSILVLGVLAAFGPLSMDLYMPQLPQLATSLGTSDALAQATMSVCMIGLGIGQLVAGPLSDRFGRRRPLLIGVALFALFSLACAFAPTIEVLLAARLLQGLAGSAGIVISFAVARDLYAGAELSRMLSLLALVTASAPIIAPLVGGQLALVMDWRGIFVILAGIGVALFVLAATAFRETLPPAGRHGGRMLATTFGHVGEVVHDRVFVTLLVASAAGGVAFFTYLSQSSFVLQNEYGLSPQLFSLAFAVNAIANMLGAQSSRFVVRRWGTLCVYLIGQAGIAVASVVFVAVALTGQPVIAVVAALAGYLFFAGIATPNGTSLALGRHAARAGTASALLGTLQFTVGPLIGPLAAIGGANAASMAITMAAGACTAALLAWAVVRPLARLAGSDRATRR